MNNVYCTKREVQRSMLPIGSTDGVGGNIKSIATEQYTKAMFKLDRKSEINKALIQRCVDKGLVDGNRTRQSLDLEMMNLARRIFEESDSTSSDDDEVNDEEVVEENGIVLGFGRNNNSQLARAGDEIRKPIEVVNVGEVKETGNKQLFYLFYFFIPTKRILLRVTNCVSLMPLEICLNWQMANKKSRCASK